MIRRSGRARRFRTSPIGSGIDGPVAVSAKLNGLGLDGFQLLGGDPSGRGDHLAGRLGHWPINCPTYFHFRSSIGLKFLEINFLPFDKLNGWKILS